MIYYFLLKASYNRWEIGGFWESLSGTTNR